jgi:hypothetical protein
MKLLKLVPDNTNIGFLKWRKIAFRDFDPADGGIDRCWWRHAG